MRSRVAPLCCRGATAATARLLSSASQAPAVWGFLRTGDVSRVAQEYRLEVLPAVKDPLDQNSVVGDNECDRDATLETGRT